MNKIAETIKAHAPEIMIGSGIASMLAGTVLAVSATPKALNAMEDMKADLGVTYLTRKEIAQCTWKIYAPAAVATITGAGAIVMGASQYSKRNSALAAVYALSETTLKTFKEKTKEIAGDETAKQIDSAVAKAITRERRQAPVIETRDSEYIISTPYGDTLIFDTLSGRYFRSSMNAVEASVNAVNKNLMQEYMMTLNDFYNELDIPTIGVGSLIGWRSDDEFLDISFDSDVDVHGNPYIVLSFVNRPKPLYNYNY